MPTKSASLKQLRNVLRAMARRRRAFWLLLVAWGRQTCHPLRPKRYLSMSFSSITIVILSASTLLLEVLACGCGRTDMLTLGDGAGGTAGGRGTLGNGGTVGTPGAVESGSDSTRFGVSSDGLIVTDTNTGLAWERDMSGARPGCDGNAEGVGTCTWAEAKAYCAGLSLDGSGWRLPTLTELESIVDAAVPFPGPTIDQTAFLGTPSGGFWTSSPGSGVPPSHWVSIVTFDSGDSFVTPETDYEWTRCVR